MTRDPDILAETEQALIMALRAYIADRTDNPSTDDMTDDAMAAINETLEANWNIEIPTI